MSFPSQPCASSVRIDLESSRQLAATQGQVLDKLAAAARGQEESARSGGSLEVSAPLSHSTCWSPRPSSMPTPVSAPHALRTPLFFLFSRLRKKTVAYCLDPRYCACLPIRLYI